MSVPIKPKESQFTNSQWQAIYEQDSNILVSASAGSGKTTVLVERVIEKIKSGISVDELLIVTFTESAAREMKQRIEVVLKELIQMEIGEKRNYFLRQLALLPMANISTIHAFCLGVIQRYYYLIGLDPQFRLLTDETEKLLLQEEVWANLREKFYEEEDFKKLTDNFSSDRNDDGLEKMIFSLSDFAKSSPDPTQWLESLPEFYSKEKGLFLFEEYLVPEVIQELEYVVTEYEKLIEKADMPELLANHAIFSKEKEVVCQLIVYLKNSEFEKAEQLFTAMTFDRMKGVKGKDEELKLLAKSLTATRGELKKSLEKVQEKLFPEDFSKMLETLTKAQDLVVTLKDKALCFLESFAKGKRKMNVLDFNDLEHFALEILQTVDEQTNEKTAQLFYQEKFKEVMIDEYQDTNQLQETILTSVGNNNLFMVGDVKQSIYAFRLADPTLFIKKYYAYEKNDPKVGKRILLQENFRSRKEVLDFTNLVFSQLMDDEVGQLAYDKEAYLLLGNKSFPESAAFSPELLLYEKSSEENPHLEDKTDGELAMVAKKIQDLMEEGFEVYDKGLKAMRPLRYEDIVLLTPTKKNNLALLATFKKYGIPVVVGEAENYFQATEIKTMLALLGIIDNPRQDIPLVAVLRSAMFNFNEEELGEIRSQHLEGDFYEALENYQKGPLKDKIQSFFQVLNEFRQEKNLLSLSQLIFKIYEKTGFLAYVTGLNEGAQRKENLLALAKRARQYEQMSYRGLFQFVRFIEKMQERNKDLAEPTILPSTDAVRVMTIHASKGLEFPVVFLMDMNKKFNLRDLTEKAIFHQDLGVGITLLDDQRVRHATIPYLVIQGQKRRQLLSEEMRKLYVALTRAEQKLFLVGSYENPEELMKSFERGGKTTSLVLPSPLRLNNTSMMDWVGFTLARHPKGPVASDFTLPELNQFGSFTYKFYGENLSPEKTPTVVEEKKQEPTHLAFEALAILKANYSFENATKTASYQSVTEIKQLFTDPDEKKLARLLNFEQKQKGRYLKDSLGDPSFITGKNQISKALIGTASHLLMQLISLDKTPTAQDFISLSEHLSEEGVLEKEVLPFISYEKLAHFFTTDLGQEILAHEKTVKREQPFSMLLEAKDLFSNVNTEDDLLIHGIVDGFYEEDDTLILYDFKTDSLSHLNKKARGDLLKERYKGQINLYAKALEESLGKKVVKKYLVALDTGDIILV